MFKLVKLEERIVLDGAAMLDFMDQVEAHQDHDELLEEMARENGDAPEQDAGSNESHFDMDSPLYADGLNGKDDGVHVLAVSSQVSDGDDLAAAAKDNVLVVKYDAEETSLEDLSKLINEALAGKKADSIAFAAHNTNHTGTAQIQLTGADATTTDSLGETDQQEFWGSIGGMLSDDGRIDLLACNVVDTEEGEFLLSGLEDISGVNVAASIDNTGSEAYGGDWVLESDGVDVQGTYFDADRLRDFDGVLNNNTFADGELFDQSAEEGQFFAYTIPADTFQDPDGDPIDYRFLVDGSEGPTNWITFYEPTRVFYGKPPAGEAGASYEVTIQASDVAGDFTNAAERTFDVNVAGTGELPVYNNPPSFIVMENSPNGTLVGDPVVATDPDGDLPLTYFIQGESAEFQIDSTSGQLSVKNGGLLDFETEPTRYDLTLVAKDQQDWTDTARVTIFVDNQEDEDPSVISLDITNPEFSEKDGKTTIQAFNSKPVNEVITVSLTFGGDATLQSGGAVDPDYTASEFAIEIPANETVGSITLEGLTDAISDPDESVVVSIDSVTGTNVEVSTVAEETTVQATITEENLPVVSLTTDRSQISELNDSTTIKAVLAGETQASDLTVDLLFDGDATRETGGTVDPDYSMDNTTITISAGASQGSVTLTAISDTEFPEGNETVGVTIDNAGISGYAVNDNTPEIVEIVDVDPNAGPKSVVTGIAATNNNINETDFPTTTNLIVTLQDPAPVGGVEVTLDFGGDADQGTDFSVPSNKIVVPQGSQISSSLTLTALTDFDQDPGETILISIDQALSPDVDASGVSAAQVTIGDNTPPEFTLSADTDTIYEDGAAGATSTALTASLVEGQTAAEEIEVFVEFTGDAQVGGSLDYSVTTDGTTGVTPVIGGGGKTLYPITIPVGESAGNIVLTANEDSLFEGFTNEEIVATAIQANGAIDLPDTEQVTIGIVDADAANAPVLDLFVSPGSSEGSFAESGTLTLDVNLDQVVATDITAYLDLTPVMGDFVPGTDYSATYTAPLQSFDGDSVVIGTDGSWEVPIESGLTQTSILLTGITDTSFEGPEEGQFEIIDADNAVFGTASTNVSVDVTLTEANDPPTLTLSLTDTSALDEDPTGTTTTTLNLTVEPGADGASLDSELVVGFAPTPTVGAPGQAGPDTDYTFLDGAGDTVAFDTATGEYQITLAAGVTETTLTLESKDDGLSEGNETFSIDFGADTKATFNETGGPINLTVLDDENPPTGATISFGSASPDPDQNITEDGSDTATLVVEVSEPLAGATTVDIDLTSSDATLGAGDPWSASEAVETGEYVVPTNANGHFYQALNAGTTGASEPISWPITGGTVGDNGVVWRDMGQYDYVLQEADGSYLFDTSGVVTLEIPESGTAAEITVEGRADNLFEGAAGENISAMLADPSQGGLGGTTMNTVTVQEAFAAPEVTLDVSDATVGENLGTSQIQARLPYPTVEKVTVDLAFSGTGADPAETPADYTIFGSSITINPGQTQGASGIEAVSDKWLEPNETFEVRITNATGDTLNEVDVATAPDDAETVEIIDDDAGGTPQMKLELADGTDTVFDENGGTIGVNVLLDRTLSDPVDANILFSTLADDATPGVDYSVDGAALTAENPITVTFNAGETQTTLVLTGLDDESFEGNESFTVSIDAITGGGADTPEVLTGEGSLDLTVDDDEGPPTVNLVIDPDTITEGGSPASVKAVLSGGVSKDDLEIPLDIGSTNAGEATPLVDYVAGGAKINIPADASEGVLTIAALTDSVFDPNEIISIAIDEGGVNTDTVEIGGATSGEITIADSDEPAELSLEVDGVTEGATIGENAGTAGITVQLETSPAIPAGESVDVQVRLNLGSLNYGDGTNDIFVDDGSGGVLALDGDDGFLATFTAGQTEASFTLTGVNDGDITGDIEFSIEFGTISDSGLAQNTDTDLVDVTLIDDEAATLNQEATLNILDASFSENKFGDGTLPGDAGVAVNLDGNALPAGATVVLEFSGEAEPGTDFRVWQDGSPFDPTTTELTVSSEGTVEFTLTQGDTQAVLFLMADPNDGLFEGNESVDIAILEDDSTGFTVGAAGTGTVTLVDDDPAPALNFVDADPDSISEGETADDQGTLVDVVLATSAGFNTIVNVQIDQGDADPSRAEWPGDFEIKIEEGLNAPVYSAGVTVGEGDFIRADVGGEDYFFRAADVTGGTLSSAAPSWDVAALEATTGDTSGGVIWENMGRVTLDGGDGWVTDGGGTAADSFQLVIPEGESQTQLRVVAPTDGLVEGTEVIDFFFETGDAYQLGSTTDTQVNIEDGDEALEVELDLNTGATDGLDEGTPEAGTLSVQYAGGTDTAGVDTTVQLNFGTDAEADFGAGATYGTFNSGDTVETGTLMVPDTENGHYYIAEIGGTAGDTLTAGDFPQDGSSVVDGGVTWKDLGQYDYFVDQITTDDYLVTIPAGDTGVDVTITPYNDTIFEGNETFQVTIDGVTGAGQDTADDTVDLTINDDETAPNFGFTTPTTGTLAEDGSLVIGVTLDQAVGEDTFAVFQFEATDTASAGEDFTVVAGNAGATAAGQFSVEIAAGQTNGNLVLTGITDTVFEGAGPDAEEFTVSLDSLKWDPDGDSVFQDVGATLAPAGDTFAGNMTDTSVKGELSLSLGADPFEFDETGSTESGQAELRIQVTGGTSKFDETVAITLDTDGAGALADDDYEIFSGTEDITPASGDGEVQVTIGAGETEAVLTFKGVTDALSEGDETFDVGIGTFGDGFVNNVTTVGDTVTGTVIDDTPAPTVTLDLQTPFEGAGVTSADDPNDNFFWEGTAADAATAGDDTAYLFLNLDRPNFGQDVTVPLDFGTSAEPPAEFGTDFELFESGGSTALTAGTDGFVDITVSAGETQVALELRALDDPDGGTAPVFEGDRSFTIDVAALDTAGADGVVAGTAGPLDAKILDDEEAPLVWLELDTFGNRPDGDLLEGSGLVSLNAYLDQATPEEVQVTVEFATDTAAEPGSDYTPNGTTITILAGETQGQTAISLDAGNADGYEGNEDYEVTITGVTNARAFDDAGGYGAWASEGAFDEGDRIIATAGAGADYIFEVTADTGSAGTAEPDWDGTDGIADFGETIADGGLVWTNRGLADIDNLPMWDDGAEVSAGTLVNPGNGFYYAAQNAGTTGETMPTFPTSPGETIGDNGVVWEIQGAGEPSSTVMGTVVEADQGPIVSLDVVPADGEIAESGGVAELAVQFDGASSVEETVYLSWEDLAGQFPAGYGTDGTVGDEDFGVFLDSAGATEVDFRSDVLDGDRFIEVTVSQGETAADIFLIATNDTDATAGIFEEDETIRLAIDDFANGGLLADTAADEKLVTILDDDDAFAPLVSISFAEDTFQGAASVAEVDGGATLPLYVTLDTAGDVTVDLDIFNLGTDADAEYGDDFAVGTDLDPDQDGQFSVTVSGGATSTTVPIEIRNDDAFEVSETFGVTVDGIIGGLPQAGEQEVIATITDDADEPDVYIAVNSGLDDVKTGFAGGAWSASTAVSDNGLGTGDQVAAGNGLIFEVLYDGNDSGDGTTGATPPAWPDRIGDTVEDGDTGSGLYWRNDGDVISYSGFVPVAKDNAVAETGADGQDYLYVVTNAGTGTLAGDITDWPAEVGATVADGGDAVFQNVGGFIDAWTADTAIEEGTFFVSGGAEYFQALDDGVTGVTEPNFTGADNSVVRDGDTNTPIIWEATAVESAGSVDETDVDISGGLFVIKKTTQTQELVQVDWEIDAAATDAVAGHPTGELGPFDNHDYAMAATSGTVNLGLPAGDSANVAVTILGDQFDEVNPSDLSLKITDVRIGEDSLGTDAFVDDQATLTINDTDPDPVGTAGATVGPDDTPFDVALTGLSTAGVSEGGTAQITGTDLSFSDDDTTSPEDLEFTVTTLPSAGTLFLDVNSDGALDDGVDTVIAATGDTFTQKDITDDKLFYAHDGSENLNDEFRFTVSDGANVSVDPAVTAGDDSWVFEVTAGAVNDLPEIEPAVLFAEENVDGIVLADVPPAGTAGPIAFDADGDPLIFQFEDPNGDWVMEADFENFAVNDNNQLVVKDGEELDYELQSSRLLHVRVTDDDMAAVTSGSATWQESYLFVSIVNEDEGIVGDPNDDFDTTNTIPDQTITKDQVAIIPILDDVFKEGPYTRVTYDYSADPADVSITDTLSWLSFDGENKVFVYNPNVVTGPDDPGAFDISVTATYWHQNGLTQKGAVTKDFTLNYNIASVQVDPLMEALEFIEETDGDDMSVEPDGMEVQDFMMVARAGDADTVVAPTAETDLSEVLALLESEKVSDGEDAPAAKQAPAGRDDAALA